MLIVRLSDQRPVPARDTQAEHLASAIRLRRVDFRILAREQQSRCRR